MRLRRVTFSAPFLLQLIQEGAGVRCVEGVPDDATVEEVFPAPGKHKAVTLTIRSESFSPVRGGDEIPSIEPTFIDD